MRAITVTVGPLQAASANAICQSQTPGAGALTLNGASVNASGVAVMDKPRRVLVTTTGNEIGKTLTLTGADWSGSPLTETLALPNTGTVFTNTDFATVTSAVISAAAAAALTVGSNTVASSPWVRLDPWALPNVALQVSVSGAVNYTVQQSMQDPNDPTNPVPPAQMTWLSSADPNVVNASASAFSAYTAAPTWVKVTLNSGSGSVSMAVSQLGPAF